MLGKFYEDVFDVELFCQMVDLICRLSEHAQKERLYGELENSLLLFKTPEQGMEEAYGLRYPGEVLERLDERETVTEKQLRALGLALAETKEFQNDGMFIGKQEPSFWKRMKRTLKKNDLYWLGIQYMMEGRQRELYEKLLDFPVQTMEELIFILSLLPNEHTVWESVKGKLNLLLGKERKFSVYTHTEIYAWLVARYHTKVKGYQKKDIETLKYLLHFVTKCKRRKCSKKEASGGGLHSAGNHVPQYVPFVSGLCIRYAEKGWFDGRTDGSRDVQAVPGRKRGTSGCGRGFLQADFK